MVLASLCVLCAVCVFAQADPWKTSWKVFKSNDTAHLVIVIVESPTERIFYLIGSSSPPSPLCAMILRGGPESNVTVNATDFFGKSVNGSILTTGIREAHGFLVFDVCEYEDKKGTATFEDYKGAICRNSGDKLQWSLNEYGSEFTSLRVILNFTSSHWDPPRNQEHHGVNFQFIMSTESIKSANPLPGARGLMVKMQFSERLEKPNSRLGVGLLIYTNKTIYPGQRFRQTSLLNFDMEEEAGNFMSTTVFLDKREPPQAEGRADTSPAYIFWRDVCFVDPLDRWGSGRRVVSFQDDIAPKHNDKGRINRSLPQAVFGFEQFNIHMHTNRTVAVMEEWFGFGSSGDGFYAKTNYTEWSFVIALGNPSLLSTSVVTRLFAPLILPVLVILLSMSYFHARRCWTSSTTEPSEITRPLIEEIDSCVIDDSSNCYPGFDSPQEAHREDENTNTASGEATTNPTSSYGAI